MQPTSLQTGCYDRIEQHAHDLKQASRLKKAVELGGSPICKQIARIMGFNKDSALMQARLRKTGGSPPLCKRDARVMGLQNTHML